MAEEKSPQYYLNNAKDLAHKLHKGQFDLAGKAYFFHPAAVAKIVADQGHDEIVQAVAYMHDLIEDTKLKIEYLYNLFPQKIIDAVDALTHYDDQSYVDYVREVSQNKIAKVVKLADLTHNMSIDRIIFSEKNKEKDLKRIEKYISAYKFLTGSMSLYSYIITGKTYIVTELYDETLDLLSIAIEHYVEAAEEKGFELVDCSISHDLSVVTHVNIYNAILTIKRKGEKT